MSRPSDSSTVATGPGSTNNLGANRATSNALTLGLHRGGVVKVLGAFLMASAGVMGVGFLG